MSRASALLLPLALGLACPRETPVQPSESQGASEPAPAQSGAASALARGGTRYLVPVSEADASQGPATALVTIVVFAEQEQFGAPVFDALEALLATNPTALRVVIKHRFDTADAWGSRALLAA